MKKYRLAKDFMEYKKGEEFEISSYKTEGINAGKLACFSLKTRGGFHTSLYIPIENIELAIETGLIEEVPELRWTDGDMIAFGNKLRNFPGCKVTDLFNEFKDEGRL